jgi:hypothetical protein
MINKATVVRGSYAEEIINEVINTKPSESALKRNKDAQKLLHKLRDN